MKLIFRIWAVYASSVFASRYSLFSCTDNQLVEFTDLQVGDYVLSSEINKHHVELMKCLKIIKLKNVISGKKSDHRDIYENKWLFDLENGSSFDMNLSNLTDKTKECKDYGTKSIFKNRCGGMSSDRQLSEFARRCTNGNCLYAQWPAIDNKKSKSYKMKSCKLYKNGQ